LIPVSNLYFECVFDDVGGPHFAVDCLHGVFDCGGCGTVALLLKNELESGTQACGAQLGWGEDDACASSGDARGYSRLIVAEGDGDERYAFGE